MPESSQAWSVTVEANCCSTGSAKLKQAGPISVAKFASFLRQDLDAVTAGLTLEWSSGIVEGHVNRVKTIKGAMYGRASFRLLRIRILTRP
ncbi:transposase [Streptomyces sp. NPDC050842]|uniref:transposase n=1 Tax=Streptomyces sp. NPDC050842 TaxID=3365636 RepID=UPI0037B66CBD